MHTSNISLKDIAKSLGLSVTAVSRALKDANDISDKTKKIVKDKADELGYVPNNLAVSLKQGNTNTIAVVINDFRNPFFAALCNILFNIIQAQGYQANLHFSNRHLYTKEDTTSIFNNKCRAVISFVEPTDDAAELFKIRNIPFFLIGINSQNPFVNCVYTDDFNGGQQVGQYFIKKNYKKALFLTNSFSETSYRRYGGFSEEIIKNKLHVDLIPFSGVSDDEIMETSIKKIRLNDYDFVFCFSDYLAIKLRREIDRVILKHKIIIFGYDDLNKYYNVIEKTNSVSANYNEILEFAVTNVIAQSNSTKPSNEYINKRFPVYLSFL